MGKIKNVRCYPDTGYNRIVMAYVDGVEYASGDWNQTVMGIEWDHRHGSLGNLARRGFKVTLRIDTGDTETRCYLGDEMSIEEFCEHTAVPKPVWMRFPRWAAPLD